jgi:hypothetical protein
MFAIKPFMRVLAGQIGADEIEVDGETTAVSIEIEIVDVVPERVFDFV